MYKEEFFNPLKNVHLSCLNDKFLELVNFYENKQLPRVLLLSGEKGIGKFTLANHFINYIFTKNTNYAYDKKNNIINSKSKIYKQINEGTFQNLVILNSDTKIENVRNLKLQLSKSSINNGPRFILIDDVETFNHNSMNALLKILEEPTGENYFILIDNKTTKLLETVSSRCLKINVFISREKINKITAHIKNFYNLDFVIDNSNFNISQGSFLRFNKICIDNDLSEKSNILTTTNKLLNLFKKNKDYNNLNLLKLFFENFFYDLIQKDNFDLETHINNKKKILYSIDDFTKYNLNVALTINKIESIIENE